MAEFTCPLCGQRYVSNVVVIGQIKGKKYCEKCYLKIKREMKVKDRKLN